MNIAMLIPLLACSVWLLAELKDQSKRLRVMVGVVTLILTAGVLFNLSFVWGYDKYHYRVSLTKIRASLDAGNTSSITNALEAYERAAVKEPFGSFAASFELNRALGAERTTPPTLRR
jgi:hypothetical protein